MEYRKALLPLATATLLGLACSSPGGAPVRPEVLDLVSLLPEARFEATPAGPDAGSGEVLVYEQGFEKDPPAGWNVTAWHGRAEGRVTGEVAHGGSRSFLLASRPDPEGREGADADVSVFLSVEGITRYRLVGWVRTQGLVSHGARVHGSFYLIEYESADQRGGGVPMHLDLPSQEGDSGWTRIEYTFTTYEQTRVLKLAGSLGNWGRASGRVWFDDVQLWKLPSPGTFVPVGRPGARRFRLAGETRSGLAVPVPSRLEYRLKVPERGVLDLALGVPPSDTATRPMVFEVTAGSEEGDETLLRRVVEAGAPWVEARADLSALAGVDVTLRLAVRPAGDATPGGPAVPAGAIWGHPTLLEGEAPGFEPPVVVWVSVDTLRADHVGHLGYARDTTPNLDRLAAEGTAFRNAESECPWTLPAHASMLTAAFPTTHGATDRQGLPVGIPVAAEMFSRAGWFCGAFTSHIYVSETYGFDRGFDTFRYIQAARAGEIVDRALAWLAAHRERPSFLFLHVFDPHWDYEPPPPFDTRFTDPAYTGVIGGDYRNSVLPFKDPKNRPAPRDLQHIVDLYDGEIRYTDEAMGRLVAGLADLGLGERALLVVTADHGEEFRDHGSMGHGVTLFEEVLHVPLVFHGPGVPSGRVVETPVRTVDILPTILDLTGVEGSLPPAGGVSLLPLLEGRPRAGEAPPAFAETYRFGVARRSIRRGPYKLILELGSGSQRLFDLSADPGETHDLSATAPDRAAALGGELRSFFDLLAAGPTKSPAGAGAVHLTTDQEEILRSLGYVD